MMCDHCHRNADHHVIFGAMCGKTLTLCDSCSDSLWEQLGARVRSGQLPWLTVPISWSRHVGATA